MAFEGLGIVQKFPSQTLASLGLDETPGQEGKFCTTRPKKSLQFRISLTF
jgi:hypothetical protein